MGTKMQIFLMILNYLLQFALVGILAWFLYSISKSFRKLNKILSGKLIKEVRESEAEAIRRAVD